jgi:UPF0176 protein
MMAKYVVSALYKFVTINDFESYRQPLLDMMNASGIRGTLLLAKEGINGTVAGTQEAIDALYAWFAEYPCFQNIPHKESYTDVMPFNRTKVKLKKEIVTMGVENIDPKKIVGTYVKPSEWNRLIQDESVILVDTRNDYEVEIGTFKGAINPKTETFREFPKYVEEHLDPQKHKKVAMFCTGGIRCEKSTAYLKQLGFEEVYHLEGGILKYLEEIPQEDSLWEGECFVFDERVAVNHQLEKGHYDQCHACRYPISDEDKKNEAYVPGVSCPRCADRPKDQQERYLEREKQHQLAKMRGESHIGGEVAHTIIERRALKKQKQQENRARSM